MATTTTGPAAGRRGPVAAGEAAPDFALNSTPDQKVSLADFRGSPVVLVFYPADWERMEERDAPAPEAVQ